MLKLFDVLGLTYCFDQGWSRKRYTWASKSTYIEKTFIIQFCLCKHEILVEAATVTTWVDRYVLNCYGCDESIASYLFFLTLKRPLEIKR